MTSNRSFVLLQKTLEVHYGKLTFDEASNPFAYLSHFQDMIFKVEIYHQERSFQ